MQRILGIDPGISGAVALLELGRLVWARDLPTESVTVRGVTKRKLDARALHDMVTDASADLAIVENVHASPGMGVSSAFSFGFTFGTIIASLAIANVKTTLVTPQAWKAALRAPANKSLSMARATELFGSAEAWPLAKHNGRAEAALLAEYGRRVSGGLAV